MHTRYKRGGEEERLKGGEVKGKRPLNTVIVALNVSWMCVCLHHYTKLLCSHYGGFF